MKEGLTGPGPGHAPILPVSPSHNSASVTRSNLTGSATCLSLITGFVLQVAIDVAVEPIFL